MQSRGTRPVYALDQCKAKKEDKRKKVHTPRSSAIITQSTSFSELWPTSALRLATSSSNHGPRFTDGCRPPNHLTLHSSAVNVPTGPETWDEYCLEPRTNKAPCSYLRGHVLPADPFHILLEVLSRLRSQHAQRLLSPVVVSVLPMLLS
jgi:hypothetical protein